MLIVLPGGGGLAVSGGLSQHRPPVVPHTGDDAHECPAGRARYTDARRVIGKPRANTGVISLVRHAASWSLRAELTLCTPTTAADCAGVSTSDDIKIA